MYIHLRKDWPRFHWKKTAFLNELASIRHQQGRLVGRMEALGFQFQEEAVLKSLTEDVLKSSEIEGEFLDRAQVRSSIARRLGMDIAALPPIDRHVEGVVEMMLDATQNYEAPLTADRLFGWHSALFPTGRSGIHKITVGAWRNDKHGPMQVRSGAMGREKIHFEAPSASRLKKEMSQFLKWFNTKGVLDPVLKAAEAHLWFVTIHPFDDGNGRIARAITDLCLARSEKSKKRFYSMSGQIRLERSLYYSSLENAQKGTMDITPWFEWFLDCLGRALEGSETLLTSVLKKAHFWESYQKENFNDRQKKILNQLLDGFEGKLTSSKWAKITQCSQDTAQRDITLLVEKKILKKDLAGGRSTSYSLSNKF